MRNDYGNRPRAKKAKGGRIGKQFGGGLNRPVAGVGSTARRDMRSGYYPNDMGMRGGPMYKKGGRVKAKHGGRVKAQEGYLAKKDESIGMRLGKGKATAAHPKKAAAERDLSYGKWGKRSRDWKKA